VSDCAPPGTGHGNNALARAGQRCAACVVQVQARARAIIREEDGGRGGEDAHIAKVPEVGPVLLVGVRVGQAEDEDDEADVGTLEDQVDGGRLARAVRDDRRDQLRARRVA